MHINDLPPEMLVKIFSYLTIDCLLVALTVCKRWRDVNECLQSWRHHPCVYDSVRTNHSNFLQLAIDHPKKIENILFRGVEYEKIHEVLSILPEIRKIEMIMCSVDDKMPQDVVKYANLKMLIVRSCYGFGRRVNMQTYDIDFKKLPKLEVLLLSDFGLSDANFEAILSCSKLVEIFIEKIKQVSQANMIKLLKERSESLLSLGINGYGYNDEVSKYISRCSNITKLRILRCETLTNKSLTYFQSLHLTQLILWNNSAFTHEALLALFQQGNMKNLRLLSLSKINNLLIELLNVIAATCLQLNSIGIYRCQHMEASVQFPIVISLFPRAKIFFE